MDFRELQLKIKEEDRLHKLAEEQRFKDEATKLSKHDIAIIEARQKRITAFEKIKEKIASQLEELEVNFKFLGHIPTYLNNIFHSVLKMNKRRFDKNWHALRRKSRSEKKQNTRNGTSAEKNNSLPKITTS